MVAGLDEMAEQVLGMLVRRGEPRVAGQSEIARDPRYATAVGLVQYGLRAEEQRFYMGRPSGGLVGRVGRWFQQVF
jgi:cell division protein FtsA